MMEGHPASAPPPTYEPRRPVQRPAFVQPVDPPPTDGPARQPHRRRGGLALAAVLALGVAVGGGVWQAVGSSAVIAWPPGGGAGGAVTPEPAAEGLHPELRERLDAALAAADAEGIPLTVTSGWRSAQQQQELYDDAVARYGSHAEARRWVLPPEDSAHVAGTAIDVGPLEGAVWLEAHQDRFGLCRTYLNEWWHFELVPEGGSCPEMRADSSEP